MEFEKMDKNELRRQWKPKRVKLLFIGEAPPKKPENFFYKCQGALFECTRKTFIEVFGDEMGDGEDFLRSFMNLGCYLVDLCKRETNQFEWKSPERLEMWDAGVEDLASEIRDDKPLAYCVVLKGISPHVSKAVTQAQLKIKHSTLLGFPRTKSDPDGSKYVEGLSNFLKNLLELGVICK